jgi:Ion channel
VNATDSTTPRRRERYGLLLGAIVLVFLVQGISNPDHWGQVYITALLGVTLLLALWTAEAKPVVMRVALVVAVLMLIASVGDAASANTNGAATRLANVLLVALAPPAIIIGVMRTLRAKQAVTLEAVLGVLCVYLLLGMLFAAVYGAMNRLGGSPFFAGGQPANVANTQYFSFTTLTTVGYGDLTARTNLGHTLSTLEALLGQIYLVTVVSLIVANLGRSRPAARSQ